jgi:lysophospholipase L1-like esterase
VHLACSGADLDDLMGTAGSNIPGTNVDNAGNAFYGEPYQVAQIPPDAALVTLTIGGNDMGFIDVLSLCVEFDTFGQGVLRCQPAYTDSTTTPPDDKLVDKAYSLGPRFLSAYQAVRAAAPHAHIVVLTYPKIFSWDPSAPGTQIDCSGIGNLDREWLGHITDVLDDQIIQQAAAANVDVLDERNAFAGHQMCTQSSPDVMTANIPWLNGSFHPSPAGYAQEAADLRAHLAAEHITY